MKTKPAFTLVELLVVISIIALLVSMLLPSLAQARDQAQRVTCQSSQKQTLYCLLAYSNDNKSAFPYNRFAYAWGTMPGNQYAIDGWTQSDLSQWAAGTTGDQTCWLSATHSFQGNSPAEIYYLLIESGGYASTTKGLYCSSPFRTTLVPRAGTTIAVNQGHLSNHWASWWKSPVHDIGPDGLLTKYTPFFSYNGPGEFGPQNACSYTNPIAWQGSKWITCVRPEYGYTYGASGFIDTKVLGSRLRLIGCPTQIQTDNNVWDPYTPHSAIITRIGVGNTYAYWNTAHYRNFGYTDGSVAGGTVPAWNGGAAINF
jgi:prepilin-type N-terminal cleavage/methylation domain-containing protein